MVSTVVSLTCPVCRPTRGRLPVSCTAAAAFCLDSVLLRLCSAFCYRHTGPSVLPATLDTYRRWLVNTFRMLSVIRPVFVGNTVALRRASRLDLSERPRPASFGNFCFLISGFALQPSDVRLVRFLHLNIIITKEATKVIEHDVCPSH